MVARELVLDSAKREKERRSVIDLEEELRKEQEGAQYKRKKHFS